MLNYVVLGILAGALSGLVGIGGGIIIVPALALFYGFTQQAAQGTTLALLVLPIGALAAWEYYKSGYVDWKVGLLISLGFVIGSFFGAKAAILLPTLILKRIFGATLLIIGVKFLLG